MDLPDLPDLPDLLFEVDSWTGFLGRQVQARLRPAHRMDGLLASLVARPVAESCNIGLPSIIDVSDKALTCSQLFHVGHERAATDRPSPEDGDGRAGRGPSRHPQRPPTRTPRSACPGRCDLSRCRCE
ncbi:Tn3 family transposase [Streptomyces sp. LBUM 1486]|nr:Tn3 family transposase [Streptomyces sp. LBUM 1485]MBP5911732.1 Tn3 family transposase [Streptomyces sp. LBUM 1486]MBP5918648.1 Tn3 family transposase [Streptomyces sp. LBUM 1486]QTU58841.1 Tn3 family transposase [Streptomyces sp. LBUM 1480]QTU59617.1 Tn3 family transposase [Streptomyces sp. LBUM 1480]